MAPIAVEKGRPRDPFGTSELYIAKLTRLDQMVELCEAEIRDGVDAKTVAINADTSAKDTASAIALRYAAGDDLPEIWARTQAAFAHAERASKARAKVEGLIPRPPFQFSLVAHAMNTFAAFAIAWCMAPTSNELTRFLTLVVRGNEPSRLFDVLAHSFNPMWPVDERYPKMPWVESWTQPVLQALSLPSSERAAALAAHMKNWQALMRPLGLKAKPRDYHDLFPYFAFDVALAVCAFDIDDSSFRDHPHYPGDLVAHYRSAIRDTRDAQRPIDTDPGLPPMEIQRPAKAELSKSKRKGMARWVELVADGDSQAVDVVLDKVGKPRKLGDIWDLMCALSEDVNHAVHGDIKDDDTVAGQAAVLARERGLGDFLPSETPPEGPARVTAILAAFDVWLAARSHRLIALENDDDAVHAVVVRAAFFDELMALSSALGIRARPAAVAYDES